MAHWEDRTFELQLGPFLSRVAWTAPPFFVFFSPRLDFCKWTLITSPYIHNPASFQLLLMGGCLSEGLFLPMAEGNQAPPPRAQSPLPQGLCREVLGPPLLLLAALVFLFPWVSQRLYPGALALTSLLTLPEGFLSGTGFPPGHR